MAHQLIINNHSTYSSFYRQLRGTSEVVQYLDTDPVAPATRATPAVCLARVSNEPGAFLFLTSPTAASTDVKLRVVHQLAIKGAGFGPANLNNMKTIALQGENEGAALPPLVIIERHHFGLAPTVRVKTIAACEQILTAQQNDQLMGPFDDVEIETEVIQTRFLQAIPDDMAADALDDVETSPVEFLRQLLLTYPDQADREVFKALFAHARAAATLLPGDAPPSTRIDYPEVVVHDTAPIRQWRYDNMRRDLPAAFVSVQMAGAAQVAAELQTMSTTQAAALAQLTTPVLKPTLEINMGPMRYLALEKIMHKLDTTFWKELPAKEGQRLAYLQLALNLTCDANNFAEVILVPQVAKCLFNGNVKGRDEDLFAGASVFLFAPRDDVSKDTARRAVESYEELYGNHQLTLSAQTLLEKQMAAGRIVNNFMELEATLEGELAFFTTILEATHPFLIELTRAYAHFRTNKKKINKKIEITPDLPVVILHQRFLAAGKYWTSVQAAATVAAAKLITVTSLTTYLDMLFLNQVFIPPPPEQWQGQQQQRQQQGPPPPRQPPRPSPTPQRTPAPNQQPRSDRPENDRNNDNYDEETFGRWKTYSFTNLSSIQTAANANNDPSPRNDRGQELCLKWHCRGKCLQTGCPRGNTHRPISAASTARCLQWCETHFV